MTFKLPDADELQKLATELNLSLDKQQVQVLLEYLQPFAAGYEYIDQQQDELPISHWGNRDYRCPRPDENPFNA